MNCTLSPVHRAPPHSFFSDNLCDCNSFLCNASDHIGLSVFCGRYISIDLSSLCPVLPNSLNVSRLKSSFVSGHHFTLTFHNSLNSFHTHRFTPSLHLISVLTDIWLILPIMSTKCKNNIEGTNGPCVVSSPLYLGLQSLFRLDIL